MILSAANGIKRAFFYFPIRFLLCGFVFAYILLCNPYLQDTENQILVWMLHFFKLPAYIDNQSVFGGSSFMPADFTPPTKTQTLFLIFFPSIAAATGAAAEKRLKLILFGVACFFGLVVSQFLVTSAMISLNITSHVEFLQASLFTTSITASFFIELALFSTITTPKSKKVKMRLRRSYAGQYLYLVLIFGSGALIVYSLGPVFQMSSDSPITAYLSVSLSELLSLKYYMAYFIYELKVPMWANGKKIEPVPHYEDMTMSFLLAAFNEEKHIRRCIESIDKAAKYYHGTTEIIIVNDGSTDNTRKNASDAVRNLRHASGTVYNIPHSGLGFALQYGLQRTTGEIVFRTDADSTIDEFAIGHIMKHFRDPLVASVSGLILPLEEVSWWQKLWVIRYCLLTFAKREWELTDSVIVQPGAFCVFKKAPLVEAGGWADDMTGEDCEITVRLGRSGYRHEYEQHAIVRSDIPSNLKELRHQRVRWSASFYQAFAANMDVIKEIRSPLSVMYSLRILQHGSINASSLFLPFFVVFLIVEPGLTNPVGNLLTMLMGLSVIDLLTNGLQAILILYFLMKLKRLSLCKFLPLQRLYHFVQTMFFEPEALEILLNISSKWKDHSRDLTLDLRKALKHGI